MLVVALYPAVSRGTAVFASPTFLGMGLNFRVDFLGFVFAVFISFIWFLVTLYSTDTMRDEKAGTRYFVFLLFTLSGCLGVFLTADFFSLFLCFEAMTVFSYVLVVHSQTDEAIAAGRIYLYMGIFGGLCLLSAMLLLQNATGTLDIVPNLEALAGLGSLSYVIAFLFFLGFGIKAAAVPLHIWIPRAYEVSPTLINAISSAAMLKAGAYGLIRVFNMLLTPHDGHSPLWEITGNLGYALLWIGIATMATGAVLAITQSNVKRVLAYSSVSQMGYIMMGIGAAAYLGYEGAIGFAGSSFHILNHAFFKAAMFLMIGAIYLRVREADYAKLGGLWRSFPVTAVAFMVAGAAISGVPGFNGYASKTLLHHSIVEAIAHHGSTSIWFAEKIFVLTSGLTFCYILRMFSSVFMGPYSSDRKLRGETWLERAVFSVFALIILTGGILPGKVIQLVITPMAAILPFDAHAVAHLADINVWNVHDFTGIAISLAIGAFIFIFLSSKKFEFYLPKWLSVEKSVFQPVLTFILFAFASTGRLVDMASIGIISGSAGPLGSIARNTGELDEVVLPSAGGSILNALSLLRDKLYVFTVEKVREMQGYVRTAEHSVFTTMMNLDYNPYGEQLYRKLTLMNVDLCIFIVIVTLVAAFCIWFVKTIGL
jgi:formate hydrogenlyase subunit 3/multisubunit Na+/H+ antiporter MnhD subunit